MAIHPSCLVILMNRVIAGYKFVKIGVIRLDEDNDMPQSRYTKAKQIPLHKYGGGPFCRFSVAKGCRKEGVYILTGGVNELYIGECQNLEERWGPRGYGAIFPRNCFKGGQETNCRINNLILQARKNGIELVLWFYEIEGGKRERVATERELVQALKPPWNR